MPHADTPPVIAVDGPAAAGKGSLARRLAEHYGFHHLDTGALYRAAALHLLRAGGDATRPEDAEAAARAVSEADLGDPTLRSEEAGRTASVLSTHAEVRAALLDYQRAFARRPPGAVLDGRDIGTVVCPDAAAKIFLEASPTVRARRRHMELRSRGVASIESCILKEIEARDARDRRRHTAPLMAARDAVRIDTDDLDPDQVFAHARAAVESRLRSRRRGS